ncbi:hypothetical protein ACXR2T_08080 [Leucobacter sp. HY1910]
MGIEVDLDGFPEELGEVVSARVEKHPRLGGRVLVELADGREIDAEVWPPTADEEHAMRQRRGTAPAPVSEQEKREAADDVTEAAFWADARTEQAAGDPHTRAASGLAAEVRPERAEPGTDSYLYGPAVDWYERIKVAVDEEPAEDVLAEDVCEELTDWAIDALNEAGALEFSSMNGA